MNSSLPFLQDHSLIHAFVWWSALFLLNTIGWGLIRSFTTRWHDAGWAISRPLFTLIAAYAIWFFAHWLDVFTPWAIRLLVIFSALGTLAIARPWRHRPFEKTVLRQIFCAELRFVIPFVFYIAMRGFSHDIIGLEKFMDFAYMNSAIQTSQMPVPDPWFFGQPINYYYFGHYVAAFLCKYSGTPSSFGYNLMLATIFGSVFQLAYAFVAEMTVMLPRRIGAAIATIAGFWLTLGGNIHGFIYGFIKPWLVSVGMITPPRHAFLISDPTRFVGYDPATHDKLIHEFPAYALYIGDLHAHLSNLPAVLLLLNVLLAWLRGGQASKPGNMGGLGWMVLAAWLIGVFAISNSWDALMYTALFGTLLAVEVAQEIRSSRPLRLHKLRHGVLAAVVTAITIAPFLMNFHLYSQGFFSTHSHTPFWQWMILYGLQTLLAIVACVLIFRSKPSPLDLPERKLLTTLTACGIAYALVPEFIYLKDIYNADYYRSNTAFKFGFQAFTLLTLAACVGLALMLSKPGPRLSRSIMIMIVELALVPPLYYAWFVLQGGFSVWHERSWTLDGQRYLALSHPEDKAAIDWLRQNAQTGQVLVEAVGDSYTFAARIATNTGLANVIGWPVHEQLWRGGAQEVWQRRDDVARLYEATTILDAKAVITRYSARWLVLGHFERERYPNMQTRLLQSLGKVVFRAGDTTIVDLDPRSSTAP